MVTQVLDKHVQGKARETIVSELLMKMPNTTAFEDLPDLQISSSAPLGGKGLGGQARLARTNSKTGAAAAEKKRIAAQRANQLVNVLNTFIGV